ncbi:MAG: EF-P lysine aminoacylase GenX [Planctomycetales bacterium]|nr:EF-P lysine aminoacylase GenX [Planctomycetales bacterium]
MSEIAVDWRPTASLDVLRRRADLLRRLRQFFDARNFWEAETPCLSHDTVVDRHLDPIEVQASSIGCFASSRVQHRDAPLWLQTSPEFGMKRLLAAGAEAIYQVAKSFRADETGRLHNPEFTMVEWYRVGDDYVAGMELLAELAKELLEADEIERVTYSHAFQQRVGLDPLSASVSELKRRAIDARLSFPDSWLATDAEHDVETYRDDWLDLLLVELVQPHLGLERPTILHDYPASQSALARVRPRDEDGVSGPLVAERFELYVRGIELANGYHELLDSEVLAARNEANNAARLRDGKTPLPGDSRLLSAMREGLPACAGTALGFDRLAMVAFGLESVEQVMAFPIDRA